MNKSKRPSNSGFTLVELLTVIAVIGILAAILIPTIGAVQKTAQQAGSQSNLRQIATAYQTYSNSGRRAKNIPNTVTTMQNWVGTLAVGVGLNDPALYLINYSDDVASLVTIPVTIINASNAVVGSDTTFPISYSAATGVSLSSPASTTPLIWTKLLDETAGTWDPAGSPWAANEGHIAFLDSHVDFYKEAAGVAAVELVGHPSGATPNVATPSITAALNASAEIVAGPAIGSE